MRLFNLICKSEDWHRAPVSDERAAKTGDKGTPGEHHNSKNQTLGFFQLPVEQQTDAGGRTAMPIADLRAIGSCVGATKAGHARRTGSR